MNCVKISYLYFGSLQTKNGPVITKILPDQDSHNDDSRIDKEIVANGNVEDRNGVRSTNYATEHFSLNKTPTYQSGAVEWPALPRPPTRWITAERLEAAMFKNEGHNCDEDSFSAAEFDSIKESNCTFALKSTKISNESFITFVTRYGTELSPNQAEHVTKLVPKNMIHFVFDPKILTGGYEPPIICQICGLEGHLQSECPDEKSPCLKDIKLPLGNDHMMMLDKLCQDVINDWRPRDLEIKNRTLFMNKLAQFIGQYFSPMAVLTIFGSSANGFAFSQSDLDICLTFKDVKCYSDDESVSIIQNLSSILKKMPGLRNVQAITNAKVPIVKFIHPSSNLEGDISLYNTLAQENTRMIKLYSLIDKRVHSLGYMVKYFAKSCDIGDASRGSLSSYAYILMLLHYLQRCNPPVIPILQELYPGRKENFYEEDNMKPKNVVDGWNAWFFDDLNRLRDVWPYLGENRQSVGTLWLGFLDYYARCFDDKNEVICIRQSRPLSKFEKMWNSPCIAIEDPFDLSHNLGAGISRKMNLYIKKAFVKTRNHFGFLPQPLPCHYKLYLFDPKAMADGSPPNDRGCRACGKIGHLVRDCPRNRKNNDDRKKREQKEQADMQERQRKDSTSKDAIVHQIKEQERIQPSRVEKILKEKEQAVKIENYQSPHGIKITKARLESDDSSDDDCIVENASYEGKP